MPDAERRPPLSFRKRVILRALPALFTVGRFAVDWVGKAARPQAVQTARWISRPISQLTSDYCRRNLRAFFGPLGWTPSRIEGLFESHQEYMARLRAECAGCLAAPRERILRDIDFAGEEHLRKALDAGRGVMLVGAHFGTWWHAPVGLGIRGFRLGAVFNSFPLYSMERYLIQHARRVGIRLCVVDQGAHEAIVRASRANEVFYLTFDVPSDARERDWVEFGPTLLNVNPGPAILAARHRMPVVYAICEQLQPYGSRVRFVPAAGGESSRPRQMRVEWASLLFGEVQRRPEQWWAWGFVDLRPKAAIATHASAEAAPVR